MTQLGCPELPAALIKQWAGSVKRKGWGGGSLLKRCNNLNGGVDKAARWRRRGTRDEAG